MVELTWANYLNVSHEAPILSEIHEQAEAAVGKRANRLVINDTSIFGVRL